MNHFGAIMTALAAVIVVLGAVVAVGRKIARRVSNFLDDWNGEPARPGVSAQPGVMERIRNLDDGQLNVITRLQKVEAELHPNGGGSLRDAVNTIREQVSK